MHGSARASPRKVPSRSASRSPTACPEVPRNAEKPPDPPNQIDRCARSEEHTSELQSLMRISYAVFCLKKKKSKTKHTQNNTHNKLTETIINRIKIENNQNKK